MSAFEENDGATFGTYNFASSEDTPMEERGSGVSSFSPAFQVMPSAASYSFATPTEAAAHLAMQHHQDIVRGTQMAATYAVQHQEAVVDHVGRHGPGIQRPLDWQTPHRDNRPGVPTERELQDRWQRALAEEERLKQVAAQVEAKERSVSNAVRRLTPNFPRKFLCLRPMVYHDIEADITADRQRLVKIAYANWWATIIMLFLNFIICLVIMLLPNKSDDSSGSSQETSQHVGLSAGYLLGIPMSFVVWYWQVYKACRGRKSATYVAAFAGLFVALAFSVFMALGLVGLGGTGAIFASHVTDTKGGGAAVPIIILCCVWIAQSCLFVYIMFRLKQFYNADGASLEEAKDQMATSAARTYAQSQ